MSTREIDIALAKAVQSIRGPAGAAWDEFMKVLVARADEITDALVTADNASLHRLQGHVQEARNLLNALAKAPKLAEQLYEEERKQRHGNAQH